MKTKAILKVVTPRIKRVLIYSKIENATLYSLPWTYLLTTYLLTYLLACLLAYVLTLSILLYHRGRRGEKELSVCDKFEGLGGWDVVGLQCFFHTLDPIPPRWPSGKASASRAEDSRVRIPLAPGFFRGRVIPLT